MKIKDSLVCGYYDEYCPTDYNVEIYTDKLKEWIKEEKPELIDFETNIEKKIAVYNILEEAFTKDLTGYKNFTVIFK